MSNLGPPLDAKTEQRNKELTEVAFAAVSIARGNREVALAYIAGQGLSDADHAFVGGAVDTLIAQWTPADTLAAAADLFRQRNAEYGANYQRMGALIMALFPEGGVPQVTTEVEANRLRLLLDCTAKLHRYAHNFSKGGHRDSARDLQVYAAMLEEFTR